MPARDGDTYALRLGATPKLFIVTCAVTPAVRTRGLSGREPLLPGHGMLFLFDTLAVQGMWMPDMRFPLDIVWLDENMTVVHVTEGAQPCPPAPDATNCPTHSSRFRAKYAIEMTAGQAGSYGFVPGLQLSVA
jgi:uncharacterized membrane protein (UPF0127 family)